MDDGRVSGHAVGRGGGREGRGLGNCSWWAGKMYDVREKVREQSDKPV